MAAESTVEGDTENESTDTQQGNADRSLLLSRIIVTWVGLLAVGGVGTALGSVANGPPQLIVYLATMLASVAVLLYNVDRLVTARLASDSSHR
ncbi:hypothetical protein [Haloglomus salinum]|uniref:hypothetical protein n=1 Tax=Haloglomus salinum TaxID=2962673 RepID=UPI0020C99014|nr:hypothetical protein [Haloglomus salinum]